MQNVKHLSNIILLVLLFILTSSNTKQEEYKFTELHWIDIIATDSGWRTKEDLDHWIEEEVNLVKQVGYVYYEDKNYIVLIDSYIDDTTIGYAIKIPKACVIWRKIK